MGKYAFRPTAWMLGLCLAVLSTPAFSTIPPTNPVAEIQRLLAQPEDQIDLAQAKLAIDRQIDPTTDVAGTLREVDRLVALVKSRTPAGLDHKAQMDVLISTLYKPGPWNGKKVYSYNLDDPSGEDKRTKRLSYYLRTKKGNCVSMPILVAILAQRLGFITTLSTTPAHMLVKFVNDDGQWHNVEATSGEYIYDSIYEKDTQITPLAIKNEIYLRPLTPREAVGAMASSLMEDLYARKKAEPLLEVAQAVLKANPKDVIAILYVGNAYGIQVQQRFKDKYPKLTDMPVGLRPEYNRLALANHEWFEKAEKLGWKQQSKEEMDQYLAGIAREKAKRTKDGRL